MSHKSGHIIIQSLKAVPDVTPAQMVRIEDIEQRDEYGLTDRLYLAWLTFSLCEKGHG